MKKLACGILILLLAVCSFGCIRTKGSYRVTCCVSNQTKDAFYMEYETFDGEKSYIFTTDKEATLSVNFVTKSGKLDCKITDSDGNEYYKGSDVETSEFEVVLGGAGKYTVKLTAKKHSGSFHFTIK